ncbi:organic hydroperoxide resistance protein [Nakamurella deserti]|uniref:organic hydroperoxide resistance protein n=1 Tax=Nakamurella deserti TaxID=2164074 RepID=UPI00197C19CE|nr:organic hydroperoxide resistance protein [Nakamurella deserti]
MSTATAIYTASATASGEGRNGHVASSDGVLDFDLAVPKEMGGPGGALTNPEQLFAAGYAACFHSALKAVARIEKQTLTDSAVVADVSFVGGEGGPQLAVALHVEIPGLEHAVAQDLVEKAHQMCPYSRATRGNIDVTLSVDAG